MGSLRAESETLRQQLSEKDTVITALENENQYQKIQIYAQQEEISILEGKLIQRENSITDLKAQLEQQREEIAHLQQQRDTTVAIAPLESENQPEEMATRKQLSDLFGVSVERIRQLEESGELELRGWELDPASKGKKPLQYKKIRQLGGRVNFT